MKELLERDFLKVSRDSLKLLIEVHGRLRASRKRSKSANELLRRIENLLVWMKLLKRYGSDMGRREPKEIVRCPHEEPVRVRRIKGNGYSYIWKCPVCWAYFDPVWKQVDAVGKPI